MRRDEFYRAVPALFHRANRTAWESYEETLFNMRRPVTYGNYNRVKRFVGGNPPVMALRDDRAYADLDRLLAKAKYPRVGQLTRLDDYADGSTELATALLHFNNPAYPIFDSMTIRGLQALGHDLAFTKTINEDTGAAYQAYVDLVQQFKDEIPYYCVPERNYYLTRIVQESLWQLGVDQPAPVRASKAHPRSSPASR